MKKRWVLNADPTGEHCPSCWDLSGQVHTDETWRAAQLYPKCRRLFCGDRCRCHFEDVPDSTPDQGDLAAARLLPPLGQDDGRDHDTARLAPDQAKEAHVDPQEQRIQLEITGEANALHEFEIMAITAGVGNGWTFTEEVLRASLSLWQGVETFVDHGAITQGRSVRDLAGVCTAPTWSEEQKGIKLNLRPTGPSAALLRELAKEVLSDQSQKPRVGFSADVIFTADTARKVKTILRVLSLDLVFNPARGGQFLRALNAAGYDHSPAYQADARRENNMADPISTTPPVGSAGSETLQQMRTLLDVHTEQQQLADQAAQAQAVQAQMCQYLLQTGLAASRLPLASQDYVKAQFAGKVFQPAELTAAIEAQRTLAAALTAGAVVQGPGRVSGMLTTSDQLQAAVDDLLGAPRDEAMKPAKVARLSGIRELYHTLTGDFDLHGGYHADRVQLATTADFAGLVKNALNKIILERWAQMGRAGYDWWKKIVVVEHMTTLNTVTGILVGTVGSLPTVAEGAEYTELAVGDSPETASFTKYGGYIPLTLELIDRDDHRKLAAYPRELASAGMRKISALVAAVFTSNAGAGPTMADTGALFNSTAVTTAGGHKNLLTTALAAAEWDVVQTAVYNQPMHIKGATGYYGTGDKMGINPRYLVVPRALELTAKEIIYPTLKNAANIYSENQQRGAPGDVVVVPDWTDANDWAAVVDPELVPGIVVAERFGIMPEIFIAGDGLSPAVFMNDEHRIKTRQFVAVLVQDFRPLHKSNV